SSISNAPGMLVMPAGEFKQTTEVAQACQQATSRQAKDGTRRKGWQIYCRRSAPYAWTARLGTLAAAHWPANARLGSVRFRSVYNFSADSRNYSRSSAGVVNLPRIRAFLLVIEISPA